MGGEKTGCWLSVAVEDKSHVSLFSTKHCNEKKEEKKLCPAVSVGSAITAVFDERRN